MPNVPVKGADGGTYQLEYVTGPAGGLVPGTAVDGDPLNTGGATSSATSAQLAAQNLTRKRVDVSNGGSTGVWLRFGSGSSVAGQGEYLPAQATGSYYTTARVAFINEASGGNVPVGFTEW